MLVLTNTSGVWTYINCRKAKIRILSMKRQIRMAERTEGFKKSLMLLTAAAPTVVVVVDDAVELVVELSSVATA